jgi:murein DD-endopeptidase MepM/ murein hydrolase activator NlpD
MDRFRSEPPTPYDPPAPDRALGSSSTLPMPTTSTVLARPRLVALAIALAAGLAASVTPALAQDSGGTETTTTTTTTEPVVTTPPVGETTTTTTTVPPDPADPGGHEALPEEPVPVVPDTVPPTELDGSEYAAQAGRIVRQQLHVAEAEAVELDTTYRQVKDLVVALEAELDRLEQSVTGLADSERAAVRRVEAARRRFEARAAKAVVRGQSSDLEQLVSSDDPNDIAVAQTLLGSVLEADDDAVRDYLDAKAEVSAELVTMAERLVDARLQLEDGRMRLVEARRASVSAQFNLAVFAAGSEIVIHGFVFPVGDPHSFGDSFGAPRMMGSQYEHAHQGTDIMAPFNTPLLACERGIVTEMGTDVLGGTKLWLKGESGTYYYYAHLSAFHEDLRDGQVVEAGDVVGLVGDTGNAKGGAPHLHFEIHPDGGAAVNPYPLLKVVDELRLQAKAREQP